MFDRCVKLETVILGAGVEFMNWGRNDAGEDHGSFLYNCLALKNVYLSKALDPERIESNQCHFFTTADSAIQGTYKKVAFFFDGTLDEATDLKNAFVTKVTSCGRNDRITTAEIISLAEFNAKFPDRTVDYDKNYIVYGINTCEAFYNSVHDAVEDGDCTTPLICTRCNAVLEAASAHDNQTVVEYPLGYMKEGYVRTGCTKCSAYEEKALNALFACQGYSAPENGADGIAIGFIVNSAAIIDYEKATNKTVSYGVFAAIKDRLNGGDVFENGEANECAIVVDMTIYATAAFEIKIVGFETDSQKTAQIAMGAYVAVTDGENTEYSYMQVGTPNANEKYCFVSFNDIVGTPSTNEDTAQ